MHFLLIQFPGFWRKTGGDSLIETATPAITAYEIEQPDDQTQLNVIQEQFPVLYEHPAVKGVTFYGYVVDFSWRTGTGLSHDDGTPRPAITRLMNYLGR